MNLEILDNVITGNDIVQLPIGLMIEGKLEKEVELSPITGKVEEALGNQTNKDNPGKMITVLLKNCVKRIGTKTIIENEDILKLLIPDRDFLSICLRAMSSDVDTDTMMTCSHCGLKQRVYYNFGELKVGYIKELVENIPVKLKYGININGKMIKDILVHIPDGYDQELVAAEISKNPGKARTLLLSRVIKLANATDKDIKISLDSIRDMTVGDRDIVNNAITIPKLGVDFETTINCKGCGEEFTGSLAGGGTSFL